MSMEYRERHSAIASKVLAEESKLPVAISSIKQVSL